MTMESVSWNALLRISLVGLSLWKFKLSLSLYLTGTVFLDFFVIDHLGGNDGLFGDFDTTF